ncbi:SBBP repeat-containing protein [Hymenobacter sp. UYCo722]|uniref:SBBP repeat-containing protein n=1 Tax=Hymenobacter sp. UYCo722 TaxID=3156335 RepID=UPI003393D5FD
MHTISCILLTLLVGGLNLTVVAQNAPDWLGVQLVGNGYPNMSNSVVDSFGNTYVAGAFSEPIMVGGTVRYSKGNSDAYLAKYASDGTMTWYQQLGSAGYESISGIALDEAGNVYITGVFGRSIPLGNQLVLLGSNADQAKLFVVRYSPRGTPEWARQSNGDAQGSRTAYGGSIATDASGQVYVVGNFDNVMTIGAVSTANPANTTGAFLARFSAAGGALRSLTTAFSYAVPPPGSINYYRPLLAVTALGEAYVLNSFTVPVTVGTTTLTSRGRIDGLVAKFNPQGRFEWVQQLGGTGDDWLSSCAVDAGGNVYATLAFNAASVLGATTLLPAGEYDGGLAKYSPRGELLWAQSGGGPGYDRYNGIHVDPAGNPFIVGYFEHTAQFGGLVLTSTGGLDALVVAYTPGGQVRWAQQAGGGGSDVGDVLGQDARGDLYVMGSFFRAADFGAIQLGTSYNNHFDNCLFVGRLGRAAQPSPMPQVPQTPQPASGLYPNPATEQVNLPGLDVGSRVQFFDAVGRLVREESTSAVQQASVQGLVPGLYILQATAATGLRYTGKLIVQ